MKNSKLELYTDHLLNTFGVATATGLLAMVEDDVSYDRITRFLSKPAYTSKVLWLQVKTIVRNVQNDQGVLIFDKSRTYALMHAANSVSWRGNLWSNSPADEKNDPPADRQMHFADVLGIFDE